jgi:hypothetical protein
MADLSITASAVVPASNAVIDGSRIAGAACNAGYAIYLDAYDAWKAKQYDANVSGKTRLYGIAVSSAESGQPVMIQVGGDLTQDATIAAGSIVYGSATSGGFTITTGDLSAGAHVSILGVGIGSNKIRVRVTNSMAAKA